MTIKSFVTKGIAFALSLSLLSPMVAFAQTTPEVVEPVVPVEATTATAEVPAIPDEASTEAPIVPEVSSEQESVQQTAPAQESVTGDVLEGTENPEMGTSTESEILVVEEATTTEPTIEVIELVETTENVVPEETPVETPEEIPMPPPEELTIVAETLTTVVETVGEEFVPLKDANDTLDPEYVLAISGKTIPTKKARAIGIVPVTVPVATAVDPETGIMTVSGSCASTYFVVLLFKNQTDYENDPRSAIVNRAYSCENGSYSYSIDRLPALLPNGTYYLMIGEQGESGSWTPASGLTEISINRSN